MLFFRLKFLSRQPFFPRQRLSSPSKKCTTSATFRWLGAGKTPSPGQNRHKSPLKNNALHRKEKTAPSSPGTRPARSAAKTPANRSAEKKNTTPFSSGNTTMSESFPTALPEGGTSLKQAVLPTCNGSLPLTPQGRRPELPGPGFFQRIPPHSLPRSRLPKERSRLRTERIRPVLPALNFEHAMLNYSYHIYIARLLHLSDIISDASDVRLSY